jgi:hypothetical protein
MEQVHVFALLLPQLQMYFAFYKSISLCQIMIPHYTHIVAMYNVD